MPKINPARLLELLLGLHTLLQLVFELSKNNDITSLIDTAMKRIENMIQTIENAKMGWKWAGDLTKPLGVKKSYHKTTLSKSSSTGEPNTEKGHFQSRAESRSRANPFSNPAKRYKKILRMISYDTTLNTMKVMRDYLKVSYGSGSIMNYLEEDPHYSSCMSVSVSKRRIPV